MATIDKKLIHFEKLSEFEARLTAGDIQDRSIVWIKDAKLIWTHGTYYGGADFAAVMYTPQTLDEGQKKQACGNIGALYASETNGIEYPSVTIN